MNLEDIQSWAASLLAAFPEFANAGLVIYDANNPPGNGIFLNDGTYPKIPGREDALNYRGLCIVVDSVDFDGVSDATRTGVTSVDVALDVLVEENVLVNRGPNGTGIVAEKALRLVWEALLGKPGAGGQTNMRLAQEVSTNYGVSNGLRRLMAHFTYRLLIKP